MVWIGPVFLVVGILLILIGVLALLRHRSFMQRAEVTEGEIVEIVERYSSGTDGRRLYFPVVRYATPQGETRQRSKVGTSWRGRKVGSRVEVYYLRDEPDKFKLRSFGHWLLALVPIIIGIGFAAIGETLRRMAEFS